MRDGYWPMDAASKFATPGGLRGLPPARSAPLQAPHLILHADTSCHLPLVRDVLPAFGVCRRSRLRSGVAAGLVVMGFKLPRGHAGAHGKRDCNDQQKP